MKINYLKSNRMKTLFKTNTILVLIFIVLSCSNEDKSEDITNDCVNKNYGVVAVNYTNLTAAHAIDITKVETGESRSKITVSGTSNDTVRLKPGNYILGISRINSAGESLDIHPSTNRTVTQCSNQVINTQI